MSTVQITEIGKAERAASFEQPFEMMEACHQRLHRTLALLERLRAHLAAHGADEQARQAARDIGRYFDKAAPHHHLDEELHVFPRLLQAGNSDTVEAVRRLQADHVQMESLWARAGPVLQALADGHRQQLASAEEQTLEDLAALYRQHITAEEQVAYPQARTLLDAAAIAAMGREMSNRRGNS